MGLALIVILLVFARFSEEKNILGRQSSNGLQWGSCDVFSGNADPSMVCANFTVPLDWSNTASDQFAYLFVAKLQARNSPALGTIFMNPGDSSYPGTSYLRWKSELLSDITGGVFDIVSWDPRGIGFTYPRISCGAPLDVDFTDDLLNARSSGPSQADIDGFLANATTIETAFKAFAQQCVDTHQDNLRYIGTVATARDLVALADAIEGPGSLIRYWGLSHGTLLGSYLLDLFPERIGRVVLDGVQDATLYSQSPSYLTYADSIRDADYALQAFFDACAEAGSSRCAIAVPGSTGTSLRQWINDSIDAAYDAVQAQNVGIRVRPSVLRHLLQATAISPESWRTNAETLASMFRDLHYIGTSSTHSVTSTQYSVQPITSSPHTTQYNGYGRRSTNPSTHHKRAPVFVPSETYISAPYAIWCGDSIDNHDVTTPEVFKEIIRITKDISNIHGPLALASPTGLCHLWPARAVERRAEQGSPKLANPILVIGTSYDPVTPIASARKLVRRLNASGSRQAVMIHHDGTGHTSLAMHSACTKDIIKRYFAEGVIPGNTLCGTTFDGFPDNSSSTDPAFSTSIVSAPLSFSSNLVSNSGIHGINTLSFLHLFSWTGIVIILGLLVML